MTRHTAAKRRPIGIRLIRYLGEIINELKKVVWLSRREIAYLTLLVLVVAGTMGLILGGLDYGFTEIIDRVFLGK